MTDTERDHEHSTARARLSKCRRLIIKIGSKSLTGDAWDHFAAEVRAMRDARREVVIVSSGAIALGFQRLALRARPKDIAWLQASAAAGQSSLMRKWEDALSPHGLVAAQVLLTHADLADRTRTNNAQRALSALLEAGAVPIINENDAVAVEEIKFGDNDQLASMVVPLVGADLLMLLSDVEGLLDDRGRRVPFVKSIAREARHFAGGSKSGVGTGGMTSKLEAAHRATLAGANVVIAHARTQGIVGQVLAGDDTGTIFPAVHQRLSARKHWIAFTLRPRGALVLDRGATEAVAKNRSVLAVGVVGVRGSFQVGDSVSLVTAENVEIARGLVRLSAVDAARACGRRTEDGRSEELVSRDDLVVLPEE
ncbi:MAG: glutamate 5-kinase [Polyangiaceae bacterium]|nr:glutamate 5-kinase [Polyangiaceae bacterium]